MDILLQSQLLPKSTKGRELKSNKKTHTPIFSDERIGHGIEGYASLCKSWPLFQYMHFIYQKIQMYKRRKHSSKEAACRTHCAKLTFQRNHVVLAMEYSVVSEGNCIGRDSSQSWVRTFPESEREYMCAFECWMAYFGHSFEIKLILN